MIGCSFKLMKRLRTLTFLCLNQETLRRKPKTKTQNLLMLQCRHGHLSKWVSDHGNAFSYFTNCRISRQGRYTTCVEYMKLLASRFFPLSNVCYRVFQDFIQWEPLRGKTRRMTYSPEIKQFWGLCQIIFPSQCMEILRGR